MLINIAFLASATYMVIRLLKTAYLKKYIYKFLHKFIDENDISNVEILIIIYKKFIWLLGILYLGFLCLSLLFFEAFDGVHFYWWYI